MANVSGFGWSAKNLGSTIEVTSDTECDFWVSTRGEGVDGVRLIMDLGIV